ncbi:IS30 family transposase [Streptomyces sp. NBC_01341]|uniref:IS30 family transposase n=1 Tax=Streptomyces sp. NBC_01341 TaxID=2903831 RepID=UPI003FA3856F
MILISDRPAEGEGRAMPEHWEGDLVIGRQNGSAIGTPVERSPSASRWCTSRRPRSRQVRDALIETSGTPPADSRRSLPGTRASRCDDIWSFTVAAYVAVCFCAPASPWQRDSVESTNSLRRQYFPKCFDLAWHTHGDQ